MLIALAEMWQQGKNEVEAGRANLGKLKTIVSLLVISFSFFIENEFFKEYEENETVEEIGSVQPVFEV